MAFNINDFRQNLHGQKEIAKVDHFEVWITPPAFLSGFSGAMNRLTLQAETAELPGRILNTIEPKIYGVPYRTPATTSYTDIQLTFIGTGTFWERKFFDAWIDYIQPRNTFNFKYRDSYVTNITIKQFSPFDSKNEIYSITLEDAYPINLAPQGLNWADDTGHKLSVAFAYTRWSTSSLSNSNLPSSFNTSNIPNISNIANDVLNSINNILPKNLNSILGDSTAAVSVNQDPNSQTGNPQDTNSGTTPQTTIDNSQASDPNAWGEG
jgi:hypothetical protein